jgi:hypothetical protein
MSSGQTNNDTFLLLYRDAGLSDGLQSRSNPSFQEKMGLSEVNYRILPSEFVIGDAPSIVDPEIERVKQLVSISGGIVCYPSSISLRDRPNLRSLLDELRKPAGNTDRGNPIIAWRYQNPTSDIQNIYDELKLLYAGPVSETNSESEQAPTSKETKSIVIEAARLLDNWKVELNEKNLGATKSHFLINLKADLDNFAAQEIDELEGRIYAEETYKQRTYDYTPASLAAYTRQAIRAVQLGHPGFLESGRGIWEAVKTDTENSDLLVRSNAHPSLYLAVSLIVFHNLAINETTAASPLCQITHTQADGLKSTFLGSKNVYGQIYDLLLQPAVDNSTRDPERVPLSPWKEGTDLVFPIALSKSGEQG